MGALVMEDDTSDGIDVKYYMSETQLNNFIKTMAL